MRKKLQPKKKALNSLLNYWLKNWVTRWLLGLALALPILIFVGYHLAYWQKIYPGITINGQPVGNQTVAATTTNLEGKIAEIKTDKIILLHNEQQWEINLAEIEFAYDIPATVAKAYALGRDNHLTKNFQTQFQAWFTGINLNWQYYLNQETTTARVATIATEIFTPAIEPEIKISQGKITIEPGKNGQKLDQEKLLITIRTQLSAINFEPIELPLIYLNPTLTEEQVAKTRQRAEKFLNQKLVFNFGEKTWELKEEELIDFLSFTDSFLEERIASQAANLALVINRPPQNAAFQFQNGRVTQFRPALDGQKLDEKKTIQLIKEALVAIEKEPPEAVQPLALPVTTSPPEITIDQVNNLGIEKLLGRGISYFWGSIPSRIHNIVLASSRLNGLLIAPGETFSFNENLGEVSPATGYQSAYVIKEGRTILDDGGGVCQVSTTFFRAALDAGLPVVERHPHSYRVNYYEQGGFGPGLDATVWLPRVDLKIQNDTSAHILVQTHVDNQNKQLTFNFYGRDDGRQVSLSKPKVWGQTAPPPDLYQDDPTLPAGTVKRVEHAIWGAKVTIDWKVTRGNEVLQERTFYSAYQPWQAVYLRGTG